MKVSLVVLLSIILLLHNAATVFAWYMLFWWLDVVMHILGGSWIALYVIYVVEQRSDFDLRRSFLHAFVLILGCVGLVGIFWEFYEYFLDVVVFKIYPFGTSLSASRHFDTLQDLFNDLLGGAVAIVTWYIIGKKRRVLKLSSDNDSEAGFTRGEARF